MSSIFEQLLSFGGGSEAEPRAMPGIYKASNPQRSETLLSGVYDGHPVYEADLAPMQLPKDGWLGAVLAPYPRQEYGPAFQPATQSSAPSLRSQDSRPGGNFMVRVLAESKAEEQRQRQWYHDSMEEPQKGGKVVELLGPCAAPSVALPADRHRGPALRGESRDLPREIQDLAEGLGYIGTPTEAQHLVVQPEKGAELGNLPQSSPELGNPPEEDQDIAIRQSLLLELEEAKARNVTLGGDLMDLDYKVSRQEQELSELQREAQELTDSLLALQRMSGETTPRGEATAAARRVCFKYEPEVVEA